MILVILMILDQVEIVAPVASLLLEPGLFVVAKLAGAPCGAVHGTPCSFWDFDLKFVNTPGLTAAWLIFDVVLYSVLVFAAITGLSRLRH